MIEEISYEEILKIRQQVMYPDKDIEFVKLKDDANGLHMGYCIDEKPVCVFSLFLNENKIQLRKFATLEEFQKKGYGSKLLEWLINYATEMQFDSIWCNSRYNKREFYKKFGFEETDSIFEENGYKFIILEKKLESKS